MFNELSVLQTEIENDLDGRQNLENLPSLRLDLVVLYSLEWFASALLGDLVEMVLQESGAQIGAFAVLGCDDEYVVHVVAGLTEAVASC